MLSGESIGARNSSSALGMRSLAKAFSVHLTSRPSQGPTRAELEFRAPMDQTFGHLQILLMDWGQLHIKLAETAQLQKGAGQAETGKGNHKTSARPSRNQSFIRFTSLEKQRNLVPAALRSPILRIGLE